MKIIIVGCGKVGTTLAEQLSAEGHEITLVEKDAEKLRLITDRIDVLGMEGNGTNYEVLLDAGIKDADLLIATTDSDERNLLSCLFGKKAGCHTIARIRDPEYFDEIKYIREELNLSMVINPELAAARVIARLIKFPSAMTIDTFARGRIDLIKVALPEDTSLEGCKVHELAGKFHFSVLICAVERGDEVFIPSGAFELKGGDRVSFIGTHKDVREFLKIAGVPMLNSVRSVMLIGGGKISYYTAKTLEDTGIRVKIIETNRDRCEYLSENLPKTIIINGDGTDQQLLVEEGIGQFDAVASLTGIDEENIMLSLYAASVSSAKLITKVNRITFEDIINNMNLGSIINPQNITADAIVSYVRAMSNSMGSNVFSLIRFASDKAEALEFRVGSHNEVTGKALKDLKFKDNLIIACINHNGKIMYPNGLSVIEPGDTVLVVTTQKGLNDLEDILA